jgi:hypothetical protein
MWPQGGSLRSNLLNSMLIFAGQSFALWIQTMQVLHSSCG